MVIKFLEENTHIREVNFLPGKRELEDYRDLGYSLAKSLNRCDKLRTLNIQSISFEENDLISILKHPNATFLKKLSCELFESRDITRDWTCYASNLRHLKLSCTEPSFTHTLIKISQTVKRLESLSLALGRYLQRNGFQLELFLTENQNTLKELYCPDYSWSEEDLGHLGQCYNLESLQISFLKENNISKKTFCNFMKDQQMKSLDLQTRLTNIDSNDVAMLLRQPNLSQLTCLRLLFENRDCRLISCAIMTTIVNLPYLKFLHLHQNILMEETYSELFGFLTNCRNLELLSLSMSIQFKPEEFKQLITEDFSNLKCLLIQNIGPENFLNYEFIVSCLKKSKSLKFLEFNQSLYFKAENKTSESCSMMMYEEFQKLFPETEYKLVSILKPACHFYKYLKCNINKFVSF